MSKWKPIIDVISACDAEITQDDEKLTLTNRKNGKMIAVYEDVSFSQDMKERYAEYIVCFATQHCHFEELDDTVPYIVDIMNDEVLPIEFIRDGKRCFGGEITPSLYTRLSVGVLSREWGYSAEMIKQYQYEIHSWSGKLDIPRSAVSNLPAD